MLGLFCLSHLLVFLLETIMEVHFPRDLVTTVVNLIFLPFPDFCKEVTDAVIDFELGYYQCHDKI